MVSWMGVAWKTFRSSGALDVISQRCYQHHAPPELGKEFPNPAINITLLWSGTGG